MMHTIVSRDGVRLAVREEGSYASQAVVFLHALGTRQEIWVPVIRALPDGLRCITYDLRGHGASEVPGGPYSMGSLVADAESVLDQLGVKDAVFVGLSIGGLVGQALAVKRLDLTRGLVLSNTAAKIGSAKVWAERIAAVEKGGLAAICPATMERWYSRDFRKSAGYAEARAGFLSGNPAGWMGCAAAISGTDLFTPVSTLRLPVLGIAGSEDGSTPPDLVRETVDLIPGSDFRLMQRVGHLPCVEQPDLYADILKSFLRRIGHV